ncbi:hypothetical protein TNCV_2656181 [Trichonephila clavipes]|nr:hypothetical protein TNCV_2656181 [Trichonephila clavipes]
MSRRRNRRQEEHLLDCERERIVGLREVDWSNRRIGGLHLGRSVMLVVWCWQQWITKRITYRRGGSGRPRNANMLDDCTNIRVATSSLTTSVESILCHLPLSRHPVVSRDAGKRSRRPLRRLPLTPNHRQCRLEFFRHWASWRVTD